jgi:hypothetical protein
MAREFWRAPLWRAAGMHSWPTVASVRDRLRRSWPTSASGRAAAAGIAALVVLAVLFVAFGLRSGATLLALPQGQILAPADNQKFGWIGRAIGQCEAEAARKAETLYFVVIPVVATGDRQAWLAKSNGTIDGSIVLLGSGDTVEGIRAGSLRLDTRGFNFSILEPSTRQVYKWRPAVGVNKFAIRDASAVVSFKPGFAPAAGGEVRWADGGAIVRERGTCYWTGALMGD